ncbi:MAG TPA: ATP-binding protein [Chloroflexia bacterium]|nr:ATP-binding protein [Chloroflexia bacterium]
MKRVPAASVRRRGMTAPTGRGTLGQLTRQMLISQPQASGVPAVLRYGATLATLVMVTGALWPLRESIGLLNIGLIFLIIVVGTTTLAGRGPGILASLVGFSLLDFFLVPPYLTLAVSELHNILALFVFLGLSTLINWLISHARAQTAQAQHRAEDVSRLYELSRAIVGAQRREEVLPAIVDRVIEVLQADACWILLPDERELLVVAASSPPRVRPLTRQELNTSAWTFRHGSHASRGQSASPYRQVEASEQPEISENEATAFVPLSAAKRNIGVLIVARKDRAHGFTATERTILRTFADQAAVALERIDLLREANRTEMLRRTDELKTALVSAVSHDLRTPLASIMASVTSLLDSDVTWDDETKQEFLHGIHDEARRLNRLVGNLLDMSRIEGGVLHPEKDWYDIGEVISTVVGRMEPALAGRTLTVNIESGLPLVLLDFTQIDQVLTNLLENSLKYTPTDAHIQVQGRHRTDHIEVQVSDDGPGVLPGHLAHLFDRFYRADERHSGQGTGLGLAISKGLVEAHGGRIWAETGPRGGLSITFTVPTSKVMTKQHGPQVADK